MIKSLKAMMPKSMLKAIKNDTEAQKAKNKDEKIGSFDAGKKASPDFATF